MNEVAQQALFGIAAPLAAAAVVAGTGLAAARHDRPRVAAVLWTLAVTLPMPIAFRVINGPAGETWQRLMWLSAVGGAIGVILPWVKASRVRNFVAAAALAAAVELVLWPAVEPELSWVVRLAPGAASGAWFFALSALARRERGGLVLAGAWVSAMAAGLATVVMGQMSMGVAVAPVGASLLALAVIVRRRTDALFDGAIAAAAGPIAATPAIAWMWMKVTGASYGLWLPLGAAWAAAAMWSLRLPRMRGITGWKRACLALTASVAVGAAAVAAIVLLDRRSGGVDPFENLPPVMQFSDQ